jgi:hypothetical protein
VAARAAALAANMQITRSAEKTASTQMTMGAQDPFA